ncbi:MULTISPECIES: hypothetical protein [unclassified Aurantimonas]|uniref:hypothetical protein n=1 Tax=unclassified Aurantimonas TaxID=2638230 RepID=UPI002E17C3D6|nr:MULTISPECIES: hypothetical protein [unclassified Aurantimonas]MEC5293080.1 hypothetical protein [Aurantimonas sp. C2-3-R2]MEC5414120.1 hypothetical protein [Aurantimonas sp. C2-4-R8]
MPIHDRRERISLQSFRTDQESEMTTAHPSNLLIQPLINTRPLGSVTLPGLLALMAKDQVDSFPALRPHQEPAWHMFLVQLAALALHRAGAGELPDTEAEWLLLLRGLTPGFAADEPWCLIVADWQKPAFLQPRVPQETSLANTVDTADALDLLITSRNHDLKQAIAASGKAEDWVFALVSLQTGEGYGGAGNHGIARMNGGSSSRSMLGLAPLPEANAKGLSPRYGAWFARDVTVLIETRKRQLEDFGHLGYPARGGIGLVCLQPWPEGAQLQLSELDIWFIEICRRVRLMDRDSRIFAVKGTSKAARIDAKQQNGNLGDPWAPVHVTENKSLTLSGADFDYRKLTELLFSGNWKLPLLAQPAPIEQGGVTMALLAAALSRGNSKTEGFKSRTLPIGGKVARTLMRASQKKAILFEMATDQIGAIEAFDKALRNSLALAAAGGDREGVGKPHYAHARVAQDRFRCAADGIFFSHLFHRFEAAEMGTEAVAAEKAKFLQALYALVGPIFETSLPSIPVASIHRLRAGARAQRQFYVNIRNVFPDLFPAATRERKEEHEDVG